MINPLVKISAAAAADMVQYAGEFGMTGINNPGPAAERPGMRPLSLSDDQMDAVRRARTSRGVWPLHRLKARVKELTSRKPSSQAISEIDRFRSTRYHIARSALKASSTSENVKPSEESRRASVRRVVPMRRETSAAPAFPCGSSGTIAFPTLTRNDSLALACAQVLPRNRQSKAC
jgi:hypothetical protein